MIYELKVFLNKRGVSPLIATVLLISFTVALGSVVLQWGKNLPDLSKPGDVCSGVSMKLRSISDVDVCYSGSGQNSYINFIIDNDGKVDIDGLQIHIIGEKGRETFYFNDFSIKKENLLNIKDNSVKYDSNTNGNLIEVEFNPIIKKDIPPNEICTLPVKTEKIGVC